MPVSAVFENLQDMSVDQLTREFGVTREQVEAVLQFVARSAEAPAASPRMGGAGKRRAAERSGSGGVSVNQVAAAVDASRPGGYIEVDIPYE